MRSASLDNCARGWRTWRSVFSLGPSRSLLSILSAHIRRHLIFFFFVLLAAGVQAESDHEGGLYWPSGGNPDGSQQAGREGTMSGSPGWRSGFPVAQQHTHGCAWFVAQPERSGVCRAVRGRGAQEFRVRVLGRDEQLRQGGGAAVGRGADQKRDETMIGVGGKLAERLAANCSTTGRLYRSGTTWGRSSLSRRWASSGDHP